MKLPCHFKIHDVLHVLHTTPYHEQPSDISAPVTKRPDPVPAVVGEEYIVESILNHRKRGKGYQFITLMKVSPTHDADWQPSRDFIDKDGTLRDVSLEYIKNKKILPYLYVEDG